MSDEFVPPSTVSFDLPLQEDDRSELTGPIFSRRGSVSLDGGLKKAELLRLKLSSNPNYFSTSLKTLLHPAESTTDDHDELLQMKVEIVRQQEKIDDLSSKLQKCELEKEALLAERAALLDEIVRSARGQMKVELTQEVTLGSGTEDSSMQLLIDANAKLMAENVRLQVVSGITRRSLKKQMEDTRLTTNMTSERLKSLERENKLLKKQLGLLDVSPKDYKSTDTTLPLDSSARTQEWSNLSSRDISFSSSEKSGDEIAIYDGPSFNGFPAEHGTAAEDVTRKPRPKVSKNYEIKDEDQLSTQLSAAVEKFKERYLPRRKSENLLVEFGESEPEPKPRASTKVPPRRWPSITEGLMSELNNTEFDQGESRKSDGLLVEFGERTFSRRQSTGTGNCTGRRAKSTARRWNSHKY